MFSRRWSESLRFPAKTTGTVHASSRSGSFGGEQIPASDHQTTPILPERFSSVCSPRPDFRMFCIAWMNCLCGATRDSRKILSDLCSERSLFSSSVIRSPSFTRIRLRNNQDIPLKQFPSSHEMHERIPLENCGMSISLPGSWNKLRALRSISIDRKHRERCLFTPPRLGTGTSSVQHDRIQDQQKTEVLSVKLVYQNQKQAQDFLKGKTSAVTRRRQRFSNTNDPDMDRNQCILI